MANVEIISHTVQCKHPSHFIDRLNVGLFCCSWLCVHSFPEQRGIITDIFKELTSSFASKQSG